jgi:hypothetical protein
MKCCWGYVCLLLEGSGLSQSKVSDYLIRNFVTQLLAGKKTLGKKKRKTLQAHTFSCHYSKYDAISIKN